MTRRAPARGAARRVLVTDGGEGQGRSAVAAIRALSAGGYAPVTTLSRRTSLAAASRHCRGRVRTPLADDAGYAAAVHAELARRPYLTVLPASDAAIVALDLPGAHLVDKRQLAQRAGAAGIPTPASEEFASVSAAASVGHRLAFPVVVKPTTSRFPARVVDDPAGFAGFPDDEGPVLVQQFCAAPLRAVAGVVWRGELVGAVHQRYLRTWPVPCGTASAAETTAPDAAAEAALLRLLDGYEGIFQAQFAGDVLLDVNPRVYGSLPLAGAAGVNLPAMWCDLLSGRAVMPVRARPGVPYRWLEGDVRSLRASVRQGSSSPVQALRAAVPPRGSAYSVASVSDPGPLVARLAYVVRAGAGKRGHSG